MFNGNCEGIADNCPCTKECKNRTPYCHGTCEKYKEWQVIQKQYSNKVKWLRKKAGYGIPWYGANGYIYKKR